MTNQPELQSGMRMSMSSVCWEDVRADMEVVNADLAHLIDAISPDHQFPLVLGTYRYGEMIMDHGRVCISEATAEVSAETAQLVHSGALCFQLSKESEQFYSMYERTIPLKMVSEGEMFGFSAVLEPLAGLRVDRSTTQVTAGARSVFMLPKVTDTRSHKRLNTTFGFSDPPPSNLSEHWDVFKRIDSGIKQEDPWVSKVLFFPKEWFQARQDTAWLAFHNYLLRKAWKDSYTHAARWDRTRSWERFCQVVRAKNLKPGPYMTDTVKHLFNIAVGSAPGYKIVAERQDALPSLLLEKAYTEVYLLKDYAPIIMRPYCLSEGLEDISVYYSLGYPTLIEGSPTIRRAPSIITELRELKKLVFLFQNVLIEEGYSDSGMALGNVEYDYYHSGEDPFGEIRNSLDIEELDSIVAERLNGSYPEHEFSTYGPFLRGCLSVKRTMPGGGGT